MLKEKCKFCIHYTAYYKRQISSFSSLNHGFCQKHDSPKKEAEICEEYKNREKKEERLYRHMIYDLNSCLNSINCIAQILKEKESDR